MKIRRFAAASLAALGIALGLGAGDSTEVGKVFPVKPGEWPMWGGQPGRNMANDREKGIPSSWDLKTRKNIKWTATLGSQSYGNPVIAGGKVFVGTNNHAERNPKAKGD